MTRSPVTNLIHLLFPAAETWEILIVGDSRVGGLVLPDHEGWTVKVQSYAGMKIDDLLRTADQLISDDTEIVVIVGLHCDLTFLPDYLPNGGRGLLTIAQDPNLDHMMNLITSFDYRWRTRHEYLTVIWTLPYDVDFLLYNELRAANRLNLEPLSDAQRYEAQWCARKLRDHVEFLAKELKNLDIYFTELNHYDPDVSQEAGGDGLHLGPRAKEEVFSAVCCAASKLHPTPLPPVVSTYMTAAERDARNVRRERSRIRRAVIRDEAPLDAPKPRRHLSNNSRRKHAQADRNAAGTSGAQPEAEHRYVQRRDVEALNAPRAQEGRRNTSWTSHSRRHSDRTRRRDVEALNAPRAQRRRRNTNRTFHSRRHSEPTQRRDEGRLHAPRAQERRRGNTTRHRDVEALNAPRPQERRRYTSRTFHSRRHSDR